MRRKGRDPAQFEWVFKAPEADLTGDKGERIGRHYGGPTWEANDGSKVVGEVLQRADAPRAGAVPWLLLKAKSNQGAGTFETSRTFNGLTLRAAPYQGMAATLSTTAPRHASITRPLTTSMLTSHERKFQNSCDRLCSFNAQIQVSDRNRKKILRSNSRENQKRRFQ
jgi:hypothetical protein